MEALHCLAVRLDHVAIPGNAVLTVYQQSLIENQKTVTLEEKIFPIRPTPKRKLKQINFQFDGRELQALAQNPDAKSRWAKMARRTKSGAVLRAEKVLRSSRWEDSSVAE